HEYTIVLFHLQPLPHMYPLFPYTTLFRSAGSLAARRPDQPRRPHDEEPPRGAPARLTRCIQPPATPRTRPPIRVRSFCTCAARRSEEHTSELQSLAYLVCRLRLE